MASYLYIGNRPASSSKAAPNDAPYGLAVCRFDGGSGEAQPVDELRFDREFAAGKVYIDAPRRRFYISSDASFHGEHQPGGCVYAYRIGEDGTLRFLNLQPSLAAKTSYVMCDETGRYLLLTNHGERGSIHRTVRDADGRYRLVIDCDESNLVLYPLADDGSIGEAADVFALQGSGPKFFQKGPHAHCVVKAPGQNLYAVCDKGGDQVWMFRIDYDGGRLVQLQPPLHRQSGSAPRYCVFHPSLPYLYVNKESAPRLSVLRYEADGRLEERQVVVNTIPDGFPIPPEDALFQSDLRLSQDGKTLYLLLRYVNLIRVFAVDEKSGQLTDRQTLPVPSGPRSCDLSPDERFLAVAFPELGRVDILPIGPDGRLGEAVHSVYQPSPATVDFCEL